MSESTQRLWSEFALANQLNPAQRHRWRIIAAEARRRLSGRHDPLVVDLGCGSGALLMQVRQSIPEARLLGVDLEPLALANAEKRLPDAEFHPADLETGSCPALEDRAGKADIILCSEVLEHLEKPANALQLAGRLLSPEGAFIVTVPSGSITDFDRAIGHRRHYSLPELEQLLEESGFHVARGYRWGFPFHTFFRIGMQLAPGAVDRFSDRRLSRVERLILTFLDALFWLNVRSRRVGRQLVAVAQRTIS